MKLDTISKLAGVAALLCMGAFAQTHTDLKVNVPFAFSVGNQKLPAGEYRVTSEIGSQAITIQSADNANSVASIAFTSGKRGAIGEARVTFHVYGDQHYLAGVWSPLTGGRTLPKSAGEREAARGQKPIEMAILVDPR